MTRCHTGTEKVNTRETNQKKILNIRIIENFLKNISYKFLEKNNFFPK